MNKELEQKLIAVANYDYRHKPDQYDFTIVDSVGWEDERSPHTRSRTTVILHFNDYYKVYQAEHAPFGYTEFAHPVVVTKVRRKEVTTIEWVNV